MKIVVFGSGGMIGSRIATELEQRGHDVTGASRSTGADITDPFSVERIATGADAIISAISARGVDYTLVDEEGTSEISAEDYAIAIADLLEQGGHSCERITVAW